jgi:hypothetical protein
VFGAVHLGYAFDMGVEIRQTEVEVAVDALYVCESCDVQLEATVESFGKASMPTVISDDEDGVHRARDDATERAEDTLMFVPCPKCGHRQSGRHEVVIKTVLVYLVATVVSGVVTGIVGQLKEMGEGFILWGSLGVAGLVAVASIVSLLTWRRHPWVDATGRTTLSKTPLERDSNATRPSDVRREELSEQKAMRKKVVYAALASIAIGGVVAAVQLLDEPQRRPAPDRRTAPADAPSRNASATAAPKDRAPFRYPTRHALRIDDRLVDVTEGPVSLGRYQGTVRLRVIRPWAHVGRGIAFVYDPSLTVISEGSDIIAYHDTGTIRLSRWSREDDRDEVLAALLEALPVGIRPSSGAQPEAVTRPIGGRPRRGQRYRGPAGDTFELFAFELDRTLHVTTVLRLCGAEPPTLAPLLGSLTAEQRWPRPLYSTTIGERVQLELGQPILLDRQTTVTLENRPTIVRAMGGWRFEHPADVTVMKRLHPRAGEVILFSRRGVELDVHRSVERVAPEEILMMLRAVQDASERTLEVGGQTLRGARSVRSGPKRGPIHEAFVAPSAGGWLSAVITYDRATETQARSLLGDILRSLL